MRILFLNQYFPPDPAPTGLLLNELAVELQAAGHEVDFVAARQDYRAGQRQGRRIIRELRALARMFSAGLSRPRPDVILSATSPPCLLLVATLLAKWHRAKSVHWIMDLYPEIAVALGEIRESGPTRILRKLMGWGYRGAAAVVALDDDMAEQLRGYGVNAEIIRPWVFSSFLPSLARSSQEAQEAQEPWTWIYSGNLGRAHEWETLLATQAILEERGAAIHLRFQGGGPARPAAEARARELGLKQCTFAGYVEEADLPASLQAAQVLAVTQAPAAQGMLWPSKLGLILGLPLRIVWIGPTDGAIARQLRALPQAGVFAPGEASAVADWLTAQRSARGPETAAIDPAAHRAEALEAWKALLQRVA